MDISVSRLNNRMALQVPGELPLGLVFIVGRVENLGGPVDKTVQFELVDEGYRLRCRLPAAVAEETLLKEKDRVRASGHLAFDSHGAQYELLARDIEVMADAQPGRERTKAPTTALRQQTKAASLVPTELPPWVKKLAPPEVKDELGLEPKEKPEPEPLSETEVAADEGPMAGERSTELTPEMVTFLSSAIDSDEEIELTPEMIADYLPETPRHRDAAPDSMTTAEEETEPAVEDAAGEGDPAGERGADAGSPAAESGGRESTPAGSAPPVSAPAAESAPSGPRQAADLAEPAGEEGAETARRTILPPPQGAPRREHQPQPPTQQRPARQYVEYAVIVLLVLLIMAALVLAVLLLRI